MTLYLHVGSHKTGTTAIQRFAASNRDRLRERGLWYPSYEEIGQREHYGHHHFAHAIAGQNRDRFSLEDAKRFVELIRTQRRDNESVLLSAEPIYRHVLGEDGDYWARRRAYVERLRDIIGTDDVVIVLVLRRQDTFALSLYQEVIKTGRYSNPFRDFIEEDDFYFEYNKQCDLFSGAFNAVRLFVYEDLKQDQLVDSFFDRLGVDTRALDKTNFRNPSLPVEIVELKRIFNKTNSDLKRLKRIGEELARWSEKARDGFFEQAEWLPRNALSEFYDRYRDRNERLRLDYAADHPTPLFPEITYDTSEEETRVYSGMSVDRFAQITANIFL